MVGTGQSKDKLAHYTDSEPEEGGQWAPITDPADALRPWLWVNFSPEKFSIKDLTISFSCPSGKASFDMFLLIS